MGDESLSPFSFEEALSAIDQGAEPDSAARRFVSGLTSEEKLWCLDGDAPTWAGLEFLTKDGYHRMAFHAARVDRVGLEGFSFSDGPRGVVVGNATCFPVSMARGSTWDPDLEERIGEAIGIELRASGANLYGGVCVNVLRHPAWGRAQETYGEDPHHVGEMGAALTRGIQRHAMACVKHFCCNSMENARFRVDISIDEIALHEVYLPHFKRIVDEGVAVVMTAYNAVNGSWCGENAALLTEVLRGEWEFKGFVISDWIFGLRDGPRSVRAGLDVEMPYRMIRATHVPAALEAGELSWDEIDESVTRVVSTLLRFSSTLRSSSPLDTGAPAGRHVVSGTGHRLLAREVAARSVVVLRNEEIDAAPLLPLDIASAPSIAVIGPLADTVNLGDGGSSDVWALDCVTVLDGLRSEAPDLDIVYDDGEVPEQAAAIAASKDVAIVVVGYTYEDEGEFIGDFDSARLISLFPPADEPEVVTSFGMDIAHLPPVVKPGHIARRQAVEMFAKGGDRTNLRLRKNDVDLIRTVVHANPRTVVVIQAGSAVISSEWDATVPAVVQAWYGGSEAGSGLADVLFGRVNPSARLPFSVPVDESHLPLFERDADEFSYDRWHGWWHLENAGHQAAYPFGFGLSYTTFDLGAVRALVDTAGPEPVIHVGGSVANTGSRDGADVVQVYAALSDCEAPRRLVGFARVEVAAGSRREFVIPVPASRLAQRDPVAHRWIAPTGDYRLEVARFAKDPHSKTVAVSL
ncbi:MAG: glycoside hydrolase family 3 C-terminal domain-containing protein [Acidimicrobiales bacterium]